MAFNLDIHDDTYILKSLKDNKYYVGHTGKDPNQRLLEHNQKSIFSTKGRVPFDLVYIHAFDSRQQAIQVERKLKSLNRGKWRSWLSALVWGTRGRGFESRLPD